MPIIDEKGWKECQEKNKDPYGNCCVKVAKRVMEILDENKNFDANHIINQANDDIEAGGITGFMAGAVAGIVSNCHSRGEEFRIKWNEQYGVSKDKKGVVNPAILHVSS